jgi:hypothetical protein
MTIALETPAAHPLNRRQSRFRHLLMAGRNTVEQRSTGRVGHPPLRGHCRDLHMNRGTH